MSIFGGQVLIDKVDVGMERRSPKGEAWREQEISGQMISMSVFFLRIVLVCGIVLAPIAESHAQEEQRQGVSGPRKQIATIIFTGLAGAVLGLSTLSFYGRPQDRLSNIAVGFAIGVVIGTGYTTFKAATNPDVFYNRSGAQWRSQPEVWQLADQNKLPDPQVGAYGFNWMGSF